MEEDLVPAAIIFGVMLVISIVYLGRILTKSSSRSQLAQKSHLFRDVFMGQLFPLLLIGVVSVAILFILLLGADPSITILIVIVGVVTAFIESSADRRNKG